MAKKDKKEKTFSNNKFGMHKAALICIVFLLISGGATFVPVWVRNVKLMYQKTLFNFQFEYERGAFVKAEYDGMTIMIRGDNAYEIINILTPTFLAFEFVPPKIPQEGAIKLLLGDKISLTVAPGVGGREKAYIYYEYAGKSVCFSVIGMKIVERLSAAVALNGTYGPNKLISNVES